MGIYEKIFGSISSKELKSIQPIVKKINDLEKEYEALSDEELKAKTLYFKEKIKNAISSVKREDIDEDLDGDKLINEKDFVLKKHQIEQKILNEILPDAFAVVREASKRVLGMRHFDVQLIGGVVLHRGKIAEMKTGEGKTLVSTLPIYLNALSGNGVHVVTVNDYLARRDAQWMGKIFDFLGLSVGVIIHDHSFLVTFDENLKSQNSNNQIKLPEGVDLDEQAQQQVEIEQEDLIEVSRADAYRADITYGTNNEYGFDYLKDNMVSDLSQKVQRPLHYAIIDEIDSILIDEARTPLIISAPAEESGDLYKKFSTIIPQLEKESDYTVDEKMRSVSLTDDGIKKIETILGMDNIYDKGIELVHHLEQALKANVLFVKDRDYVVKEGEIVIVDEFTGRLMFGRRYSDGLHQAIEAKEGVEIKKESITLATITFQNYFRIYKKLSGMTGTAMTESEEFYKIYKLDVIAIPTNNPMIRIDNPDKIYQNEEGKFISLIKEIKEKYEKGQPVLVGTISIEKNELLSHQLKISGIPHEVLNAKHHEREASIISQAGAKGAVTVATNMAGRGVDIILGGHPYDKQKADEVRSLGGLAVFGTERHESRRIDNQLRGRAGRQGDPGESQFFISMEDDLMRIFGAERIKRLMNTLGIPSDQAIENKMVSSAIETAQKKVEGHNFDIRKHVLEYDDVMNRQRKSIYSKRDKILLFKDEIDEVEVDILDKVKNIIQKEISLLVDSAFNKNEDLVEAKKEIWDGLTVIIEEDRIKLPFEELNKLDLPDQIKNNLINILNTKIEELISEIGEDQVKNLIKSLYLRIIDMYWVQHLTEMDHLRSGIGLVGYSQKDPLVEYKHRSFNMFKQLLSMIDSSFIKAFFRVKIDNSNSYKTQGHIENKKDIQYKKEFAQGGQDEAKEETKKERPQVIGKSKVGRNDPCPCGSGKKYKKCCGQEK
uniref:Protein translocase subunit SecA n=1 Tax=candidate division CPR3 bacterium TaxID=2268181 RepID=A0A7C4R4A2_UNCC3